MGEAAAIEAVDDPVTVPDLGEAFQALGVEAGDTLLVHSSLKSIGWVCGGAPAVVDALQTTLTDAGTLVMPTHSPQCSDPASWSNPPVPEDWVEPIRRTMPPYRPELTPTWGVGAIPECFRNYPGVHRSPHPVVSFAAWGADAETLVETHPLDYRLSDASPLGRVYDRDGDVLLLGVDHGANTSLHLAENRAVDSPEPVREGSPILDENGERVWREFENIDETTDDFADVGAAFEREVGLVTGEVGAATAKLMSQRELVDFAVEWFEANRQ